MKIRKLFLIIVIILLSFQLFAQTNNGYVFPAGHWIYNSLYTLAKEQKVTGFYENSMMTAAELKFYFDELDYDSLSDSGKLLYEKVAALLSPSENGNPAFTFIPQLRVNPEVYYKSNDDIPFTFNYNYKDNFLTLPLIVGFSDSVMMESDIFFGKSHIGAIQNNNYFNIPFREDEPEFMFPRHTYGAFAKVFDGWGLSFVMAKEGLSIGNTKTGSIFYNNTFETDAYMQMNLFAESFKYSLDIVQVDYSKNLYLHQVEARPWKQFKIGFMEGTQIVGPFELRFINPFMVQHSLSAWNDLNQDDSPYGEEKICAYFGFNFDWTPVKNVRIYGIYAQNEIQAPNERDRVGVLYPNSLGFQLGTDFTIPSRKDGFWNVSLEGIYTSPYLYYKHTAEASLYREREDNMSSDMIKTWIGTPLGPDCLAFETGFGYEKLSKWKWNVSYMLTMKGENDFSLFDEKSKPSATCTDDAKRGNPGTEYYSYYPVVAFRLDPSKYDECKEDAQDMWLHGIIQYTNQISAEAEYSFNEMLTASGRCTYTWIFNNNHISDVFEKGLELTFAIKYNVF